MILIGLDALILTNPSLDIQFTLVPLLSLGNPRSKLLFLEAPLKLNIEPLPVSLENYSG